MTTEAIAASGIVVTIILQALVSKARRNFRGPGHFGEPTAIPEAERSALLRDARVQQILSFGLVFVAGVVAFGLVLWVILSVVRDGTITLGGVLAITAGIWDSLIGRRAWDLFQSTSTRVDRLTGTTRPEGLREPSTD